MSALDFPSNPVNGQGYSLNGVQYYYDSAVGAWLTRVVGNPVIKAYANVGNTAPVSPGIGEMWFNTGISKMFIYYNDGDTSQWIEPSYGSVFTQDAKINTISDVANSGYSFANTVNTFAYGVDINTSAAFGFANGVSTNTTAAFAKANTALANTTNTVFSGNITITGTSTVGSSIVSGAVIETRVAMAANDINLLAGSYFTKTIGSATTLTVSNVPTTGNVASFILDLTNGGAGTITWWSGTKFPSNTAPTLTASGRDVLGFFTHDGGTTWSGLVLGKDIR